MAYSVAWLVGRNGEDARLAPSPEVNGPDGGDRRGRAGRDHGARRGNDGEAAGDGRRVEEGTFPEFEIVSVVWLAAGSVAVDWGAVGSAAPRGDGRSALADAGDRGLSP